MIRGQKPPVEQRSRRRGGFGATLKRLGIVALVGGSLAMAYNRLTDAATRQQLRESGEQLKDRATRLAEQAKLHATTLRR